jgi:hypothetical protein
MNPDDLDERFEQIPETPLRERVSLPPKRETLVGRAESSTEDVVEGAEIPPQNAPGIRTRLTSS